MSALHKGFTMKQEQTNKKYDFFFLFENNIKLLNNIPSLRRIITKKTKTSQIMYMVIINNNFSVNNIYVISEQFCFSEPLQLKLLREIMEKYQLENKMYGNRSLIIFRQ